MFEFDLLDPGSWGNFRAPYLDPSIPTELLKIGGLNHHGQPRLRAIWGGSEQVFIEKDGEIEAGWYLKYHLCFVERFEGFEYVDPITGETRRVPTELAVPGSANLRLVYSREEIGKPRWIIEIWRDVGDFDGAFKEEGYYHLLTVQKEPIDPTTGRGPYRPIDRDVLNSLKGMIHFMENTTESEREARRAEDDEREKERKQKAQDAIWEGFGEQTERTYEHTV